MRRVILFTAMLAVMCIATSQAELIYDNPSGGTPSGWNWGTDICSHSAQEVDLGGGNLVIRHTGVVSNTTGAAADARFGSKWDFTVSGNTSADPADYTIAFDVRNVSGDWNPYPLGVAVLTKEDPDDQGHGYPSIDLAQADGWVHVEINLADWNGNWWQGADWDLTNPNWSLEVGGPGWPGTSFPDGTSFTQIWEMDNLKIYLGSVVSDSTPYDPIPVDQDPLAGTEINLSQAEVTLGWKASVDPNSLTAYPVNPAILRHNVYLSNGIPGDDPNVYLIDSVVQVHNADPNLTDPNNFYGPLTLQRGVTYYWQIEEVIDNGAGGYGDGDPNNIFGPLWSFSVVPATASISPVSPSYSAVDAGSEVVLSVTATAAETYQWYKIGDPDVALTDGADYGGVNTNTLTIYDVQVADEGQYYCEVTNPLPSSASNRETGPAIVLTKRLMSHYPMEAMDYGSDANGVTVDLVSGVYDMRMASNDQGFDVPVLDASSIVGASALRFDNPAGSDDPNNVYAQYAEIENPDLVAYEDITISAWVYSNGGAAWNRIVDFGNNNQDYIDIATNWWGDAGRVGSEIHVAGAGGAVVSPVGALVDNEWTFVMVTLSGDQLRLYMDGELVSGPETVTQDPIEFGPTSQNWLARSQWGGGDGYFDGLIDEVKIYNYGLTAAEAGQKYLADEAIVPWVCDWEAWGNDSLMTEFDINDDCEINLTDFAAFAGKWLEDAYQIKPLP